MTMGHIDVKENFVKYRNKQNRSNLLIRGSRVNFRVYKAVKMPRMVAFVLCHLGGEYHKIRKYPN
jgi:hypothetical protein